MLYENDTPLRLDAEKSGNLARFIMHAPDDVGFFLSVLTVKVGLITRVLIKSLTHLLETSLEMYDKAGMLCHSCNKLLSDINKKDAKKIYLIFKHDRRGLSFLLTPLNRPITYICRAYIEANDKNDDTQSSKTTVTFGKRN